MPTTYPASNDSFKAPDNPNTVVTASAGDSARNHTESHQDMGDAIVALEQNASLLTHDHSNTGARPTAQLNQANTHQNADTDHALSSLHHTIGVSANQAAAGNHLHTGIYLPNYTPYYSRVAFAAAGSPFNGSGNSVISGNWLATDDVYSLWTTGIHPLFTIPVTGKWNIYFRACFDAVAGIALGAKVLKNFPAAATFSDSYVIAGDSKASSSLTAIPCVVSETIKLTQNDTLRFSVYSSSNINLFNNIDFIGDSYMSITYLGF